MIYTGYLRRTVPKVTKLPPAVNLESPYLLITAGGGGDGDQMMDWVLRAYETRADLMRAVLVLGPFMRPEMQTELRERASKLDSVEVLTFDTHLELMMEKAAGIVAMGGYNTFCEILSLDKPALIMPRVAPRKEQLVRAERAAALGVARMFDPSLPDSTLEAFVAALRDLPRQAKPSSAMPPGFLDGVERVGELAGQHFHPRQDDGVSLFETGG
jgi:predicted glycosyltransferase